MSDVFKTIAKGMYYLLAAALVLWTGTLTVDVGFILFPNDKILPFFMLALFDAGTLSWLLMFLKDSRGRLQRALSLAGFMLDLLGVFLMAGAGMYFSGQTLATIPEWMGQYVLWGVIAYTAVNVTLIYLYHIADPDELQEIKMQQMQDRLDERAMDMVEAQVNEQAAQLAGVLQRRIYIDALARMALPIPADSGNMIEGKAHDVPAPAVTFASETQAAPDVTSNGNDDAPVNPTKAGKRR